MPAAAAAWVGGFVITAFGAGAGAVVAGTILAGLAYVGTVLGVSYALAAVSSALMGRPKGPGGAQYREFSVKAAVAPRAIIYGEATVGGVVVFEATAGVKNRFLDIVIVLAGHQVDAITDVWLDDEFIANTYINSGNAAGGAVATPAGTKYQVHDSQNWLWIYKYTGTDAQTASTVLTDTSEGYGPTYWTSAYRLRGCAYVHLRFLRNDTTYPYGAPSSFRFRVKGAKVYDPRLDSTNGGTGTHRLADATTWAYSVNPALAAADYIAGGTIVNDVATPVRKRGFAVPDPATSIDWDSVIAAANVCDEDVAIPGATTQNRYELGGLLAPSDDSPDADCIDQILSSMVGQVVYSNGVYRIFAGDYSVPTYTLTDSDLAGPIRYVTAKGRGERYNTVRGTKYNLDTGIMEEFVSKTDSSYVTDDGRTLYRDIELPMTTNDYRAQRIAQLLLRRSREQATIIFPGQASAMKIGVWETVSVTLAELGISSKVFRCISRKLRPCTDGSEPIVELTLREENSATYTDPDVGDYDDATVGSDFGGAVRELGAPTGLTATPGNFKITFSITPTTDETPAAGTVYDIYEYTSSTPFSSATLVWSGAALTATLDKRDTTVRYYWVRARHGDLISSQYPATTGVSGYAVDDGTGIVPDPYFARSTAQDYWEWNDGAGTDYTGVSISLTGGVQGGKLSITGDSSYKAVWTKRVPLLPVVTGQNFSVYIRYRRTGSLSGTDAIGLIGVTTSAQNRATTMSMSGALTITGINGKTVNQWQEATTTLTAANLPKNQSQLPYAMFAVDMDSATTGGTVEVDALIVTPI